MKVLAINGSYRKGGVTDQVLEAFVRAVERMDMEIEVIFLRDWPIEFCTNCRKCTQEPGDKPGACIHKDAMASLIEKIEQADRYILASPTNFYSSTALFKRFMERLVVYAYWPWGTHAPKYRKAGLAGKKAVVVSSAAAPGLWGRLFYGTIKQLKITAKTIGANTVDSLSIGLVSKYSDPDLPKNLQQRITRAAAKLQLP